LGTAPEFKLNSETGITMADKAVFLDRDGTLNEEMGYINHASRFRLYPFVPEALSIFKECGFKLIIVTNQSGIARGYFTEELLKEIHDFMHESLAESSIEVDAVYYCPHHPDADIEMYKKDCGCRKPKPGMIEKAKQEFNIDLSSSFMIGDRWKDVEFGKQLGLKTIMVLTGYGKGEYTYQRNAWPGRPDHICENLLEAANYIKSCCYSGTI